MKAGDKFTFESVEYFFYAESKKNNGGTHFFAQKVGCPNIKMRQIAYADLIVETAKVEELNPRFVAFNFLTECKEKGMVRNSKFMSFISEMLIKYAKLNGDEHTPHSPFHIQNQEDFTNFIVNHPKLVLKI